MSKAKVETSPAAKGSEVDRLVMYLATKAAREIFKLGDEPDNPCQRIEFKGGTWPETETPQGGLDESALARYLTESLKSNLGDIIGRYTEAI